MGKRPYFLIFPALLLPALPALLGGWAVVSVDQLPEYLVARQATALTFMVRQHGITPLKGVHPVLVARAGSKSVQGTVAPGRADGQYVASFSVPEPGDWTLTIESGWGNSKLTLLPIKAIAAGTAQPIALAAAELGRHLFVAKGCVGCHVRSEANLEQGAEIGPSLTGKRWAQEWLQRFLANPAMADRPRTGSFVMPNLNLRQTEIAGLVAFLNGDTRATY